MQAVASLRSAPLPGWFRRRPLFWLALAGGAGLWAAARWGPVPALPAGLLAGVALAAALGRPLRLPAALAAAALLFALRAGLVLRHEPEPLPRPAAAFRLRGTVLSASRAGLVLRAHSRAEHGAWRPQQGRFGVLRAAAEAAALPLLPGDLVEVHGRLERPLPPTLPGGPDERLAWRRRGTGWVLRARPGGLVRLGSGAPPPVRAAHAARRRLLEAGRRALSPRAAVIVNNFLLGEEHPPDPALARRVEATFRAAGVIHLLVISGTQVTLVLAGFVWLGTRLHRLRYACWLAGALALVGYVLVTEGGPPVARAAVMGAALLAARLLERQPDAENTLGLAALVLFLADPLCLFDIGFQLSYGALWGLMRLTPALTAALAPRPARLRPGPWQAARQGAAAALAASVGAHLGVAPLLAYHFHASTWSSVLANLPMAVLAPPLLLAAAGHLFLSACLHSALLAPPTELLAGVLYAVAAWFAAPPFGAGGAFPPPDQAMPLLLAGVALPALARGHRAAVLALTAAAALALLAAERLPAPPPRRPVLHVLDVGQGDALLARLPGGATLLVDAGPPVPGLRPDAGAEPVVRALRALRVPALSVAVATHPDADHIGGLPAVLSALPVGLLLYNGESAPGSQLWQEVHTTASRRGVPLLSARPGSSLQLGRGSLAVLGPPDGVPGSTNERSVVLHLRCEDLDVLLTGDAGHAVEEQLLARGRVPRAAVLKVGHHGSADATGNNWLAATRPRLALISCGRRNSYGHPEAATLARLHAAGAVVARTDLRGTLTLQARGHTLELRGTLPPDAPPLLLPAAPLPARAR